MPLVIKHGGIYHVVQYHKGMQGRCTRHNDWKFDFDTRGMKSSLKRKTYFLNLFLILNIYR